MANPDGAKPRKEEANMAMTLASVGVRNDQDYSSDAEGHNVDESALIAAKNAKKKSCFQITSVKASDNPHNDDNDSIDDMDESRAEDFSSSELLDVSKASTQTDLDRLDLEEKAHSTPKKVTTNNVPSTNSTIVNANQTVLNNGNRGRRTGSEPPHELQHQHSASSQQHPTNGNQHGNGNPSRFIVVKVPRLEPFTRGRWTCRDFETQPSSQSGDINRTEQQQNKDLHSGDSSAASSVHYEYVPGENPNVDNPILGESSTTGASVTSEQTGSINSNTGIRLKSHSHTSKGNISGEDQQGLLEHNIKETLNMDPSSGAPSTDDISEEGDGTSAGGAIDNKIEQAMDLVKSHLLFAVREEVEVLKVKIQELSEKNEQLQRENALLRQNPGQPLPPPAQQTLPPNAQPQGTPMAIPQQTLHQQQQPAAHPQGMPQQQTKPQVFAAAAAAVAAAQGQTLPPQQGQTLPPQGQLQALPMAIPQQTLPPQQAAPHTQGIPQQPAAAQHPAVTPTQEQYTHLQQQQPQAIPMQQQQHSIPGTQQAGVLQQPQLAVAPQQPVHNQQQPPKT